jgi:hypothetical protein
MKQNLLLLAIIVSTACAEKTEVPRRTATEKRGQQAESATKDSSQNPTPVNNQPGDKRTLPEAKGAAVYAGKYESDCGEADTADPDSTEKRILGSKLLLEITATSITRQVVMYQAGTNCQTELMRYSYPEVWTFGADIPAIPGAKELDIDHNEFVVEAITEQGVKYLDQDKPCGVTGFTVGVKIKCDLLYKTYDLFLFKDNAIYFGNQTADDTGNYP